MCHKHALDLSRWLEQLSSRKNGNVAVVAFVNKLVRIAWAVLAKDQIYRPSVPAPAGSDFHVFKPARSASEN